MKLRLLTLLLSITSSLVAQTTLELTYEYLNAGLGEKRIVTLLVNNQGALSFFSRPDSVTSPKDFALEGDDEAGRQVYRNAATGELTFRDFVSRNGAFEPCLVKDPLRYTWSFEHGSRKIGPYECRAANTHFRGRTYTAWYTEGLSVPHGPWKFTGLPGAVVEIRSADEAIAFRLLRVTTTQKLILPPSEAREISMKDFVALREGSATDFINRVAAQLPRGAQVTVSVTVDYNLEISFDDVRP